MTFPDNEMFNDFFSSLKRFKPKDDSDYTEHVISEKYIKGAAEGIMEIPARNLYTKNSCKLNLKGVQEKIAKYLGRIRHINSNIFINDILYLITFIDAHNEKSKVQIINEIFENHTTADVNQFLILRDKIDGFSLKLYDFEIGTIDSNKIKRYCDEMGSTDYFERYSDVLRNKFGINRDYFRIPIINVVLFSSFVVFNNEFKNALDHYFDNFSTLLHDDFFSKFDESQELMNFLSSDHIDLREWRLAFAASGTEHFVTIFRNITKKKLGWVNPTILRWNLHLDSSTGNELIKFLKNNSFDQFAENEIDNTFKKFTSFCAKGQRYFLKRIYSEAYLHYVIGLDILFGDKDSSTQSVSKRTAFFSHHLLKSSFNDALKEMKEIYNLRSKYVHEGREIHESKFESLELICKSIFQAYLNLRKNNLTDSMSHESWIKKLDLGIAKIEAEEKIDKAFMKSCGII